jgi:hypothetical protein
VRSKRPPDEIRQRDHARKHVAVEDRVHVLGSFDACALTVRGEEVLRALRHEGRKKRPIRDQKPGERGSVVGDERPDHRE